MIKSVTICSLAAAGALTSAFFVAPHPGALASPAADAAPQRSVTGTAASTEMFQPAMAGAPVAATARELDARDAIVLRRRAVTIRVDELPGGLARAGAQLPADLTLNFFDDAALDVVIDRIEPGVPGDPTSRVLAGRVKGAPESAVFLSVCGDAVIGDVAAPGVGDFQVRYIEGGVHEAREVFDHGDQPCGIAGEHHLAPAGGAGDAGKEDAEEDEGEPGAQRSTGPVIDVMIAYTPAARNYAGSASAMQAELASWISQTNAAYVNSQIMQTIRLVHVTETNYTESSSASTDLTRLRNTGDGFMDELHAKRDQYGADIVHLASRSPGVCGIAFVMTNVSTSFRANAFGITVSSCGAMTFAHELGHNMGCSHDHDNGGSAAYCYSYGHRTPGNQYRTIMSYAPGARVSYFSNPNLTYQGHALGVTGNGCPTNAADNARSINNTASTMANLKPTASGATPSPTSFALTQPGHTQEGIDLQPTLTWQASTNATGYLVVVSTSSGLGAPVYSQLRPVASATLPGGALQHDTLYYWAVTAVGAGGETPGSPTLSWFRTRKVTDLNGDGLVNGPDLALLLTSWGPTSSNADITGDGVVDALDLGRLLGDWE